MKQIIITALVLLISIVALQLQAQTPIKATSATTNSLLSQTYVSTSALIDGFVPGSPMNYQSAISPTTSNPVWVQVDLGNTYSVGQVKLYWNTLDFTGNGTVYVTIDGSNNASTYVNLYKNTPLQIASNTISNIPVVTGNYRYIRVTFSTISTASKIRLRELESYCAQRILFEYDAAGNRIRRYPQTITFTSKSEALANNMYPEAIEESLPEPIEETIAEAKITLFPNPTTEILHVKIENNNTTSNTIEVFDVNGRVVYTANNMEELTQINVSTWNKGMYVLRMQLGTSTKEWPILKQ